MVKDKINVLWMSKEKNMSSKKKISSVCNLIRKKKAQKLEMRPYVFEFSFVASLSKILREKILSTNTPPQRRRNFASFLDSNPDEQLACIDVSFELNYTFWSLDKGRKPHILR